MTLLSSSQAAPADLSTTYGGGFTPSFLLLNDTVSIVVGFRSVLI